MTDAQQMAKQFNADEKSDHWQHKAGRLAADNVRLRNGLLAIKDRMEDAPHIKMRNGITVFQYCRELLIGATPELEPKVGSKDGNG